MEQIEFKGAKGADKQSQVNVTSEQNLKYSSKSRTRGGLNRSKAREVIDDEEDNAVQFEMEAKNEAAYGSDE